MQIQNAKALLLSSVLLTVLMIFGVGIVGYDALTIREAEEFEEDTSKLLLNAEQWLNHVQEIDAAARNYVFTGKQAVLVAIQENRRGFVEHERHMQEVLKEYQQQESGASIGSLLKLNADHQRKIDEIVAYKTAGNNANAQRRLAETDVELFSYNARKIIEGITRRLHDKRSEANNTVTFNVLRGSISFGLMSALMIAVIWIGYTVTARAQRRAKELSEQLALRATHDPLTNLPNRDLFYDRLSQSISQARRKRQRLAVLYLDLDGFKAVNDTYGHQVGDATLKEAARRLRSSVRQVDTVARLGGDEFAIILNEIKATQDAGLIAEKVIASMAVPMPLYGGNTYRIGTSIGIATYPECGVEIDRLVKAADDAMYASKAQGKNCFTYANADIIEEGTGTGWVSFTDDFLVGVSVIDEQHEALASLLNSLNVALARQEPLESLFKQLDDIIAYAGLHFETEERLMAQHRYPDAKTHREEHERLSSEVKYLRERFTDGGELLVLQWLKDWLLGHIAGSDRRMSEYLIKCGVR